MLGFIGTIIRIKVSLFAAVVGGLLVAGWLRLRREHATWGVIPGDTGRPLAGDDLVPDADVVETRSIDIAAAPAAVWPWLVQMGYGRGGWYSYDQLDMRGPSARTIVPELQGLAEGDLVPTHPGGGFVARVVDAPRALVLYLDDALVKEQLATSTRNGEPAASMPAGLHVAGAMGEMTMPDFRASWAFVLEDAADGGTRLIERFRVRAGEGGLPQRLGMPFMGYGVFAMTRRQMLGIKSRAEAGFTAARSRSSGPGERPRRQTPSMRAVSDARTEGGTRR
jgi:hypothetical protein